MATWREALDNVRAGNVALKDNTRFSVGRYNYIDDIMLDYPQIILEIQTIVGTPDERVITFRDGSIFGFGYTGNDSGNFHEVYEFVNIKGYPVIGQTTYGTDYTWKQDNSVLNYVEWTPQGSSLAIAGDADRCAMCFGIPVGRDGNIDPSNYLIWSILYATHATGSLGSWTYSYNNSFYWETRGEFGYLQSQSHVVDFLAGEQAEPEHFPGDPSTTGGGSGWFISQNDVIAIPSLPSIQAIDFGFSTIYNPTVAQMQSIAAWLWSDDFDENIKLNFVSPFDNIISISLVPMNVPSIAGILRVGNVDSNIPVNKVTQQYHEIDCGSLNVLEFWGSFLDYNAAYSIWLPFIGYRSLKPDDMVNGTIGVIYHVDILTGLVLAFIWTIKEDGIKHVLYTYTGNMNYNVAFSGANYMAMYNQQLSATVSGINNAVQSVGKALSGDITGAVDLLTGQQMAKRQYETAKPDYGRGGNGSGGAAIFGIRYPYLIQTLPIGQVPNNYGKLNGYPSQVYAKLSDLHGYTEIDRVITDTLTSCTAEEKEQIIRLLKNGVVL